MSEPITKKMDYGFYHDALTECFKKFGSLFEQPIIADNYAEIKEQYTKGNILDMGAGKYMPLLDVMKDKINGGKYYTLDNDPEGKFDFQSFADIPKDLKFDLVVANQFFEHLSIDDSIDVLESLFPFMNSGGKVIATVPNISHPNRQISNITHLTAWGYNSFYTLFKRAGYEMVRVCRYSKVHPSGFINRWIANRIATIYRMDWCDSILVVAVKK